MKASSYQILVYTRVLSPLIVTDFTLFGQLAVMQQIQLQLSIISNTPFSWCKNTLGSSLVFQCHIYMAIIVWLQ